ncbi:hypothetical protein [Thiohalorhabdus methylotrophus]|uniref:Uncharacterized protein n=1 Tax=Thiohalorhabdus methylotrophus TaxID=3242694 RepID=A0ABV4TWU3_9GAMM
MPLRLPADHVLDLLPHSEIRLVAREWSGGPLAEGRTAWARQALRRRLLRILARIGARYLIGAIIGMLAGWAITALVVMWYW